MFNYMHLYEICSLLKRADEYLIEYRMKLKDKEDMIVGHCIYRVGRLFSLDGNMYSLNDKIQHFSYDEGANNIIVWIPNELEDLEGDEHVNT